MKKLSIITPTFNRKEVILDALQSLESQTSKDFEWIIVDNGSEAESLAVQEHIKNIASFPVRLAQNKIRGPSACRTLGSTLAESELIAYLDDDDGFSPDSVQTWIETFEKTDADLIALSGVDHIHSVFGFDAISACDFSKADAYFADDIKRYLIPFRITFARFAYRKTLMAKAGFWNEALRYREDCEFLLRFLKQSPQVAITSSGKYLYNKRKFSDKYIDEPYILSAIESYKLMLQEVANTPAKSMIHTLLANEAHNMWLKASIFHPDIAEQLKFFAEENGVACNESITKRKFLRFIKTPFRRSSAYNYFYKKARKAIGR